MTNNKNRSPDTTILLSTYNGANYLAEQLNSIIAQTHANWKLVIRDDGSSDATLDIIKQYTQKDSRIIFRRDSLGNLGPSRSFFYLMSHVDTEYFMFSDQDDVWLPHKIQMTIQPLQAEQSPALVFTDLVVVDQNLDIINSSFMKYSRFCPKKGIRFPKLLAQNIVVGCTVAGNSTLIESLSLDFENPPPHAIMHDWWLALAATAMGKIKYLSTPTILYRQHSGNCLGAKKSGVYKYATMLFKKSAWTRTKKYLELIRSQATNFNHLYALKITGNQTKSLAILESTGQGPALIKLIHCFINGISLHKVDRNLALIISHAFLFKRKLGKPNQPNTSRPQI